MAYASWPAHIEWRIEALNPVYVQYGVGSQNHGVCVMHINNSYNETCGKQPSRQVVNGRNGIIVRRVCIRACNVLNLSVSSFLSHRR